MSRKSGTRTAFARGGRRQGEPDSRTAVQARVHWFLATAAATPLPDWTPAGVEEALTAAGWETACGLGSSTPWRCELRRGQDLGELLVEEHETSEAAREAGASPNTWRSGRWTATLDVWDLAEARALSDAYGQRGPTSSAVRTVSELANDQGWDTEILHRDGLRGWRDDGAELRVWLADVKDPDAPRRPLHPDLQPPLKPPPDASACYHHGVLQCALGRAWYASAEATGDRHIWVQVWDLGEARALLTELVRG